MQADIIELKKKKKQCRKNKYIFNKKKKRKDCKYAIEIGLIDK